MADGYVDLSPVVNAVNSAINTVNRNLGIIQSDVNSVGNAVVEVNSRVGVLKQDLEHLKARFEYMIKENRRQAALQRAITEIIRVRQELEQNFGNYKVVRDTMIGILEATDLKLIRQETLKTCTEELMLTTPRYWLAPVLIALSSWIADNKPLATRALKEALRRDEEKTCLTFALICRRNGRTKACFEWLSRYFAMQKANDMKTSIIAYIDAYTNGVFGEDRDNLCEEYIQHWMAELSSPEFEEHQKTYWKGIYQTFTKDTTPQYAKLAECAPAEFARMNEQVMRINSAPEIIAFFQNIMNTEVDQAQLVRAIDNELIKLVKNYDKDEAPLREEEEYLTDIKNKNGDEDYANARKRLRELNRMDKKVDLAERLSEAIVSNNREDISAKKTAIRFMKKYIKGAFGEYITEKAGDYPKEVTVKTNDWSGKTTDGSNVKELESDYKRTVEGRRSAELARVKNTSMIVFWVLALIGLIVGVVGFAVVKLTVVGAIGLIVLAIFAFFALKKMKSNKAKRTKINADYDAILKEGLSDIQTSVAQLVEMNGVVAQFNAKDSYLSLLPAEGEEEQLPAALLDAPSEEVVAEAAVAADENSTEEE